MAVISSVIPNLINGVSQQPFALRLASQAEAQENTLSSVAEGLLKRPNTHHVARLSTVPFNGAYVHTINRDASEKYVVILTKGTLRVFDFQGQEKGVAFPAGKAYLAAENPEKAFNMVTVADHTFIVNKTIRTAVDSDTTAPKRPHEGLVWVRQGAYKVKYTVYLDGKAFSITTLDGSKAENAESIQTDRIAVDLYNQIYNDSAYKVEIFGSVLRIQRRDAADFTLRTSDSFGDQALFAVKDAVQSFTSLPKKAVHGFQVELRGSPSNAFDTSYVEYVSNESGDGVWKEIPKPGRTTRLDPASMPHSLIREADGTFTFRPMDWTSAHCGDETTNPHPSFVGLTITDIFFYRNRLGFIADENVVFSKSGDFFTLYRQTVTAVLDTDPVDLSVSHVKVSLLRHAIPFNESLLLFSDQTQFILTASEVLTPHTATIAQTTEFEASLLARPAGAGRYVYFAGKRGGFSSIREYYIDGDTQTKDANDITAHVPRYIPDGVFRLVASTNEDCLFVLSRGQRNALWVYRWFFEGNEKAQSAWSVWTFDEAATILNVDVVESTVWFVVERPDGVWLESLNMEHGRQGYEAEKPILLDRLTGDEALARSYNSATDTTTVTLPWKEPEDLQVIATTHPTLLKGTIIGHKRIGDNVIALKGNHASGGFVVGRRYAKLHRFSPLLLRDEAVGGGQTASTEGRLQISYMTLNYADSGYFRVEVTPTKRNTYRYVMSGQVVGSARSPLGRVPAQTGAFRFAVMANHMNVTVDLINDSHLPSRFLNAEWEGKYTTRATRRS